MARIFRFASLPSTMREAARLSAEGYPAGTVIVADEQTAGIGRHGHSWHSEPGAGLYVSILLRPTAPPTPALTIALGLATAEAIGPECDLRWPNDVMLNGRKVAGVLVQMHDSAAIAGIGINVNHMAFPEELAGIATSLRIETGREYSREDLLQRLLEQVELHSSLSTPDILRLFDNRSSYARGLRVTVERDHDTIEGVTIGLDDNGFLKVCRDDGRIETILAGGVRAAGARRG